MGRPNVNVLIENLDHVALGFDRAIARVMGQPGYQPATLLKIFIYGHLNRVQARSVARRAKSWRTVSFWQ